MKRVLLPLASLVLTAGVLQTAAHAADAEGARVVDRVRVDGQAVRDEVRKDRDSARTRKAKAVFLEDQARAGVLWDTAEVSAATLGRGTDVAFSNNVSPTSIQSAVVEQSAGHTTTELQAIADLVESSGAKAQPFRAGSDSLQGVSGQVSGSYDGGALTVQVEGDKLTSAWERYQVREAKDDRKIFYYGHWATAVGKVVDNGYDHTPGVIDIRSRPKVGRKDDFKNMRNYWPKEAGAQCDDYTVGIGILGFSASLPLGNCEGFVPDPDATNFLMKNVWSAGACRDSRSEYVDLGMAVDIKPTISTAVLSDYSYARFEAAPCDQNAANDVRVIYADPGWS